MGSDFTRFLGQGGACLEVRQLLLVLFCFGMGHPRDLISTY